MKRHIILLILLTFLLTGAPAHADHPVILIVNSYGDDMDWVRVHNKALRREMGESATFHTFYMDTKRLPKSLHKLQADKAMALYEETRPDIVVLTDDNALKHLGKSIASRGTPVVYLGVNENPRRYFDVDLPITGVLERPLFKRSIVFIKDLFRGKLHKCLIMFDDSTTSRATCSNVFKNNMHMTFADTTVELRLIPTFMQWKHFVSESSNDGYDAIIVGLYHTLVDAEDRHVPEKEVLAWTSANSPVPVFAYWDFSIGKGKAVGGMVQAGEPQGVEAARLIKRILAGESAEAIHPVTAESGRFVFSRSEMERWGISFPVKFVQPGEELIFLD